MLYNFFFLSNLCTTSYIFSNTTVPLSLYSLQYPCHRFRLDCCAKAPADDYNPYIKGENVIFGLWGRHNFGGNKAGIRLVQRVIARETVRNVALILHSDVFCNEGYLNPILGSSKLKFVYVTHESSMIDNKRIFLWPLGIQ